MDKFLLMQADLDNVAREVVERPLTRDEATRVFTMLADSFLLDGKLRDLVKDAIRIVALP